MPVFNEQTSVSTTKEKDTSGGQREITQEDGGTTVVMENDGDAQQPFITKKYNPKITGIVVVAEDDNIDGEGNEEVDNGDEFDVEFEDEDKFEDKFED